MNPPLHDAITHLAFLLGTWHGSGEGRYPTIEPFAYSEQVDFGHVGKPFIAYTQRTKHADTGQPLHAEQGYLRPVGVDRVELVVVQPSGIVEMHDGTVDESAQTLDLATTQVLTTPTAKEVTAVSRKLSVDDTSLSYTVDMGAVGQPLQHHLAATLHRIDKG